MPLALETAQGIIHAAHQKASALGVHVSVAVVDDGGNLIALGRMDGAPPVSPVIAEGKAVGAAMFRRDGASLLSTANDRPAFFSAVSGLARVRVVPGLGSVLIHEKAICLGAVGVSGASPEQDLECAEASLKASV